jgi:hypothetical protein
MCSSVLSSRTHVDPQAVRPVLARIQEQFLGLEIRYESQAFLLLFFFVLSPSTRYVSHIPQVPLRITKTPAIPSAQPR